MSVWKENGNCEIIDDLNIYVVDSLANLFTSPDNGIPVEKIKDLQSYGFKLSNDTEMFW